ncbi:MAG: NAD(+)/NADH kinase, partial [Planctomycetes bacterium]|nr:NAD(+)/NADH kinase [Planctomycetota bacterium]
MTGAADAARGGDAPFDVRVERVLVLADRGKADVEDLVQRMEPFLQERCAEVTIEGDLRGWCKRAAKSGGLPLERAPDLVIVLGGDGSILAAVHAFGKAPIPILGVNFGRVGFLASVPAADWKASLDDVLSGRAIIEPRTRLSVELLTADGGSASDVALNDIVLSRGSFQGMLSVAMEVDGYWVSDYRADGLIVATASGSTAHSLAAGGPILSPTMGGVVVTPICAHALSHRPVVLERQSEIQLTMAEANGVVTLAVDGHGFYAVQVGD